MKILLIRHGQSTGNVEGRFTGQTDVMLTELGKTQAKKMCDYVLCNYTLNALYSSALTRAQDTAKPLSGALNIPVVIDQDANEINMGVWENALFSDIARDYPQELKLWSDGDVNVACKNGESFTDLYNRTVKFLMRLTKTEHNTVAVCTHGGVIRSAICFVKYGNVNDMSKVSWGTNASVTEIDYTDGKFCIVKEFYDDFLGDQKSGYIPVV